MQELIQRITAATGIDEDLANKAVGMILGYVQRAGEDSAVANLLEQVPGASDLIAQFNGAETEAPAEGGGGLMGMAMGMLSKVTGGDEEGGIMAIGQSLMADGLDMGQIKGVAEETFQYAREQAGDETVDAITSKIPGLSNFL